MKPVPASITDTLRQFARTATKYAQSEDLSIRVNDEKTVTTREAHAIQAIYEQQGANITKTAASLGITRSAASQMIEKLARKGYVEIAYAPGNAKEYRLSLSRIGHEAYAAHKRFHGKDLAALANRMTAFSPDQVEAIRLFLVEVANVMDERLARKKRRQSNKDEP